MIPHCGPPLNKHKTRLLKEFSSFLSKWRYKDCITGKEGEGRGACRITGRGGAGRVRERKGGRYIYNRRRWDRLNDRTERACIIKVRRRELVE